MKPIPGGRRIPGTKPATVLRAARHAVALVVLVLVVAGCSGSPAAAGRGAVPAGRPVSSPAAMSRAVAFSQCMRSHGVPEYPDPASRGGVPKVSPQQVGVSDGSFRAAESACGQLLEPGQAAQAQIVSGMLSFSRCMRAHGVPDWPDPSTDSNGNPEFNIPGINPAAAQISNAADGCTHLLVQSAAGPTTVLLCNGIGEQGGCHGYGDPAGG